MDCYKGMAFCYRECANMECDRNIKHVPDDVLEPICMAEFMDCEKYKGIIELETKDYEVIKDDNNKS